MTYLAATVNAAAVAKHHGVKAFINMSQMTLSQMSITETTASPQHKLHWLAEQALNWSGLPVVHVRPTVLLEGFFLIFTSDSVRESNQIRLPFGEGKTSPVAVEDVARVLAALLANPQPHIGKIYHLTGPQSENMHFYAQEYSKALGRTITFQDIPVESWRDGLLERGLPVHLVNHLVTMADLHRAGPLRPDVGRRAHANRARAVELAGFRQEECGDIHRVGKSGLSVCGCSHSTDLSIDLGDRVGAETMETVTYDKEITTLLVIDPYNDFISEGGKVWDRLKGVSEANKCVPHMTTNEVVDSISSL